MYFKTYEPNQIYCSTLLQKYSDTCENLKLMFSNILQVSVEKIDNANISILPAAQNSTVAFSESAMAAEKAACSATVMVFPAAGVASPLQSSPAAGK